MIKNKKMMAFASGLLVTAAILSACGQNAPSQDTAASVQNQSETAASEKVKVYTSFYPLYYVSARIGGEHVEVKNIVPSGVEPHDFEPTAKDIVGMSEADLFVYNGSGFEGWVEKALDGFDKSKMTVVNATEGLTLIPAGEEDEHGHGHAEASGAADGHAATEAETGHEEGHEEGHEHGPLDPHVWLDPTLLKAQAAIIKDALAKRDAAHAQDFEKNYEKLAQELDTLDKEFADMVAAAPKKEFMVSHSAFGYLAQRYGLEQVAISGVTPADEPSPAKLKELVNHVKEHQIGTILFESLVSPKVAEVIARETGAKTAMLNPLEGLTAEEEKAGKDYFSIMRENLETLRAALQ